MGWQAVRHHLRITMSDKSNLPRLLIGTIGDKLAIARASNENEDVYGFWLGKGKIYFQDEEGDEVVRFEVNVGTDASTISLKNLPGSNEFKVDAATKSLSLLEGGDDGVYRFWIDDKGFFFEDTDDAETVKAKLDLASGAASFKIQDSDDGDSILLDAGDLNAGLTITDENTGEESIILKKDIGLTFKVGEDAVVKADLQVGEGNASLDLKSDDEETSAFIDGQNGFIELKKEGDTEKKVSINLDDLDEEYPSAKFTDLEVDGTTYRVLLAEKVPPTPSPTPSPTPTPVPTPPPTPVPIPTPTPVPIPTPPVPPVTVPPLTKMAIVQIDGRFVGLHCVESPDVRFEDVLTVVLTGGRWSKSITLPMDATFRDVCEPDSIVVVSATPSRPVIVGARIVGPRLTVEAVERGLGTLERLEVNVRLSGIRKQFAGVRFPVFTEKQARVNNAFYAKAQRGKA